MTIDLAKLADAVREAVPEVHVMMAECFVCVIRENLSIFAYDNGMVAISGVFFVEERRITRIIFDAIDAQRGGEGGRKEDQ